MSLKQRVAKLEGGRDGLYVALVPRHLTADEQRAYAEDCRRDHGLAPDAVVVVLSGKVAEL